MATAVFSARTALSRVHACWSWLCGRLVYWMTNSCPAARALATCCMLRAIFIYPPTHPSSALEWSVGARLVGAVRAQSASRMRCGMQAAHWQSPVHIYVRVMSLCACGRNMFLLHCQMAQGKLVRDHQLPGPALERNIRRGLTSTTRFLCVIDFPSKAIANCSIRLAIPARGRQARGLIRTCSS